jgi:hypothetical protein
MKADDPKQAVLIGESFSRWHKAEVACVIVRKVSRWTLVALIRELAEAGVTLEMIVTFLQKHRDSWLIQNALPPSFLRVQQSVTRIAVMTRNAHEDGRKK